MYQLDKKQVASLIKQARNIKGYTQQELSDLTGISLRSVQRIENGEVIPRSYTLRILREKLELTHLSENELSIADTPETLQTSMAPQAPESPYLPEAPPIPPALHTHAPSAATRKPNQPQKIILTIGIGIFLLLGTLAFVVQAPKFPETNFEALLLWLGVAVAYLLILLKLWK